MDDAPPPRLRGTPLLIARAAALTVSLGVFGFLVVRAGGGCRSTDVSAVAEPPSAAAPAASSARPEYFGGSKSWGGGGLRVPEPSAVPAVSASSAPAARPKGKYFEGSKSGLHVYQPDEDGR